MEILQAFHGDPAVKAFYINRVRAHRLADNLIQGKTWEHGKGCAVGCTLEAYDHSRYPIELGIPEWLGRLQDRLFEGLPNSEAMMFPEVFYERIEPGATQFETVKWKFSLFLLGENAARVSELKISDQLRTEVINAIRGMEGLYVEALETGIFPESAAESAAWSAESAESAESAAWSARSAAWLAAYVRYRDELFRLLSEME